ncbi:MAG: DUF4340 domain-containing protein [Clostridia bacterium]|nr:DUF4340 domain-containing protein [Clostridia bacterium]
MKKRSFGLVVLVSLLVVVIIFYSVISNAMKNDKKNSDPPSTGDGIYIDRQPSEVEKVTYRTGGAEFTVRRDGSIFVLDEDPEFPLDPTAVAYMMNSAARLTYVRKINPESNDLTDYGLSDPQSVIEILYTDNARLTITVGNFNPYSDAYYCTTGDGFVYLMGGEFSDAFAIRYSDIILHDTVETPQYGFSSVTKVEITGNGKTVLYTLVDEENGTWERNGESGDFAYDLKDLYNELYRVTVDEWIDYNVETDKEFDTYGLLKPEIRVVFTHLEITEIENEGSSTVKKEHELQTAFLIGSRTSESEESDAKRYFAFGGGSIVYVMQEDAFAHTMNEIK